MTRVLPVLVLLTATPGLLISCGPKKKKPTTTASVTISKQVDSSTTEYRVMGAEGMGQPGAKKAGVVDALIFAAKKMTGDPTEKTQAADYVRANMDAVIGMANPGRIMKNTFASDGKRNRLDLMVRVNTADLKRHLIEQQVITASRAVAKGAGKPTIMVVFKGGDCERGNSTSELCQLPAQIKAQSARMKVEEEKLVAFQKTLFESDCLKSEVDERSVKASTSDKSSSSTDASARSSSASSASSRYNASASGSSRASGQVSGRANRNSAAISASGSRSSNYSGSRSSASSSSNRSSSAATYRRSVNIDRESQFEAYSKSVRSSPNCVPMMNQLKPLMARVSQEGRKLDALYAKQTRLQAEIEKSDSTTVMVNKWFVNERWELVDASAVDKARKLQDAMQDVEGLGADPVASLAAMAGADIFFKHNLKETNPNNGYQAIVTLEAAEVTSGKVLSSVVGESNVLPSKSQREKAIKEAVEKAMQEALNQITAYWSDMGREGVKTKFILRGDFSQTRTRIRVTDALGVELKEALGPNCDDVCAWEPGESTKQTINGVYISPAKARRAGMADRLIMILEESGFAPQLVLQQKALNIIEL